MSTADENANILEQNEPAKVAKGKKRSPRGKAGNLQTNPSNKNANEKPQQVASQESVSKNKKKQERKKRNKKRKKNAAVNGTANGITTGSINSVTNAATNGATNGTVNAITDDSANSNSNGVSNGHVNGTTANTNGTIDTHANGAENKNLKDMVDGKAREEVNKPVEILSSDDHAASVMNVPGARRVSRSRSSILEASKSVKINLQLKQDNPNDHYKFGDEIARGKFAVVKKCTDKRTGETFAAKLVKYDEDTKEVTKKEFQIWNGLSHPNLLVLHDAYLVRKYLVLISEMINGVPILDHLGRMANPTEDDVAAFTVQLLEALEYLQMRNVVHLDIKPGNLLIKGNVLKLIDYGSSRKINSVQGEVGEMVGSAEFMSPEMINFEPVSSFSDVWGVGVVTYALLSGFSPFACEDEDETMASVTALDYRFEQKAFASITEEAKSFIKRIIIRIPEKRPGAGKLLEDPWLDETFSKKRENSAIDKEALLELSETLKEQDKLEEVRASTVLKTFLQSPYESPETSENEEEDGEENA